MTPALAAASLTQVALFVILGWVAGDWLAGSAFRKRGSAAPDDAEDSAELEWPERALLGAAGFVALSVALMVGNLVLGGLVFGVAGVVPATALVLLFVRRRGIRPPREVPWRMLTLFLLVVTVLWSAPTLLSGTAARSGDIPWHLGWTEQLLAGEPVPEGPAPAELAENAYPWGFHAVLATLVRLVPGSDPASALIALQLLLMASVPLAAACLARRVVPAAGWAAACVTSLIGGFGWLLAREPAFETSPPQASFGADLVVASPNAVYGLFPPPLPRELGLVLLAAAAVVAAAAFARRSKRSLIVCGVCLGCAGLVSVPALVAGIVWLAAAVLVGGSRSRLADLARILVPAAVVFLLWAGPVIRGMVIEGGLVNVSPSLGREWPVLSALGSWGLLLPLILLGAAAALGRPGSRIAGSFAAATVVLLGLSMARGAFDWALAGNATVLHQGRIWPIAHLLAAAVAGIGLWHLWRALYARRAGIARVAVGSLLVVGAASPALASIDLSRTMIAHEGGYAYRSSDLDEGSFMRRVAARLGPEDTLIVRDTGLEANELAFHVFSFSGARLGAYDDPKLTGNDLRIRFHDLAERWDERIVGAGFDADYEIVPSSGGPEALETGVFAGRSWDLRATGDVVAP
ncbi:MAG: hypothetical protein M3198_13135 [Actinomycetota bacterium]|nr:hypothetical protein [Actinomycetota bacterium]